MKMNRRFWLLTTLTDTYTSGLNIWTGQTFNETSESNIITIAATFNVHFY